MSIPTSRREALLTGLALASTSVLAACSKSGPKETSCNDTIGMPPADLATRENNEYVERSPDPAKICNGCQLWQPKGDAPCGGCTVVKGPINPKGHCKLYTVKVPS